MEALDKIPSRVKYYLLDFKDSNKEYYKTLYGEKRLRDFTKKELIIFFGVASRRDLRKMSKL